MTWKRGAIEVHSLLESGHLEQISGAAANGSDLLMSSARLLESAERELTINPEAAYILGYDSARKECTSLLARQGLRTRSSGHHLTTERVVKAQFGGPFNAFGALRRRRSEIEYPRHPGEDIDATMVSEALEQVREIYISAVTLLDELTLYRKTTFGAR
jgi:hypothetical protein